MSAAQNEVLAFSRPASHLKNQEATMKAVVGVFKSRSDAEVGAATLTPLKIPRARINVLTPEVTDKEIAAVPTMASEQPGMGEAIGAVVGGAMGVAGGAGFFQEISTHAAPENPIMMSEVLPGGDPKYSTAHRPNRVS